MIKIKKISNKEVIEVLKQESYNFEDENLKCESDIQEWEDCSSFGRAVWYKEKSL